MNIAIIFSGGKGIRLNGDSTPKQFLEVNNKPILVHTLERFQYHPQIDKIYISILSEYFDFCLDLIKKYNLSKVAGVVYGGDTAQKSIYNALKKAAEENPDNSIVLIHDGVRPIITEEVISANIESVKKYGTGITSTPCYETILVSSDGKTPQEIPIRRETFAAQAPQSFFLKDILDAHEIIQKTNPKYTDIVDSCTLFDKLEKTTHLVAGNSGNIKITTPQDMYILGGILKYNSDVREGNNGNK
jgi:2-C-methyl-D-erythritol 4-phosphate cytidylyltransferase